MLRLAAALAIVVAAAPAHADRTVAFAPLTAVGNEDTSPATKKLAGQLEAATAALPGTQVIPAATVNQQITAAKQPQLRACELEAACLAQLGKLVGASVVIAGEVVGIGEARVIYLSAVDVTGSRPPSSTTLTFGSKDDGGGASGAIVRLLEPQRFTGTLHFAIDTQGATVYVNGSKVALSGTGDVTLPVGTQAVRVTHPEYRDFVRFIDVPYGKTTDVAVGLTQYPIVQRDVQGKPLDRDHIRYVDPPLWRRWYVVGPAAVGLAIVTGIVVGYLAHDLPDGECRKLGGDAC